MINVVFVNKTNQKVTSVKMDYIKSPQSNCTVMDIEGDDPKFRECSIWKEGSVTSAPEISKFCADNKTTFDAHVCDGVEEKTVDEYWPEFAEEEEEDSDGDDDGDGQEQEGEVSSGGGGEDDDLPYTLGTRFMNLSMTYYGTSGSIQNFTITVNYKKSDGRVVYSDYRALNTGNGSLLTINAPLKNEYDEIEYVVSYSTGGDVTVNDESVTDNETGITGELVITFNPANSEG